MIIIEWVTLRVTQPPNILRMPISKFIDELRTNQQDTDYIAKEPTYSPFWLNKLTTNSTDYNQLTE